MISQFLSDVIHWPYTPLVGGVSSAAILAVLLILLIRLATRRNAIARIRAMAASDPAAPSGARGFYVGAAMTMAVSVNTSWRYFGTVLGIDNLPERTVMFSVLEVALIACGFGMRAEVRRTDKPGPARMFAWLLCALSGYMAVQVSGPLAGAARVALGPALGLVMLHLALGIEVRTRTAVRVGTWARVGREFRERALSRFGLADDARDALARTRDRAAGRAARLALAGHWTPFRGSRLTRALRSAGVAHDPGIRSRLLAELAVTRHAVALATLDQPSPWDESAVTEQTDVAPVTVTGSGDHPTGPTDRDDQSQDDNPSAQDQVTLTSLDQDRAILASCPSDAARIRVAVRTVAPGHNWSTQPAGLVADLVKWLADRGYQVSTENVRSTLRRGSADTGELAVITPLRGRA